jgi:hypothetical protein
LTTAGASSAITSHNVIIGEFGQNFTTRYDNIITPTLGYILFDTFLFLLLDLGSYNFRRSPLFVFPFDASTSASSTSSRISYVLKTNFPLIATRFAFLRSLRTYSSSLASVSSLRRRAFSEEVLHKPPLIARYTAVREF